MVISNAIHSLNTPTTGACASTLSQRPSSSISSFIHRPRPASIPSSIVETGPPSPSVSTLRRPQRRLNDNKTTEQYLAMSGKSQPLLMKMRLFSSHPSMAEDHARKLRTGRRPCPTRQGRPPRSLDVYRDRPRPGMVCMSPRMG